MAHAAPPHGAGGSSTRPNPLSAAASSSPGEWSGASVISALQSESLGPLERVAAMASRGEIRDLEAEDAWANPHFYAAAAFALKEAWKAHDRVVIGQIGEDAHANFMYDAEHQGQSGERHSRLDSGMDDEEEELGEAARVGGLAVQEAWRRLQACYTFVARLLAVPELQADVARRRGGFDQTFAAALVARFEPRFRKHGGAGAGSTSAQQAHQQFLQAVTGVGGVAIGSRNASPAAATAGGRGAPAPASAMSLVGMGVKNAEPDSPQPAELSLLRGLLHALYSKMLPLRPGLRNLMGNFLQRFLRAPQHPQGVSEILQVYGAVLRGAGVPLHPQHRDFLSKHLLPLHQPHAMLNELSPVLQSYHESLVYVLIQFLEKEKERDNASSSAGGHAHAHAAGGGQGQLCELMLSRILLGWPNARAANSPKEVLLLHECEKILEYCPVVNATSDAEGGGTTAPASGTATSTPPTATGALSPATTASSASSSSPVFHRLISLFLPYLLTSLTSFNHRVAERALQFWQNDRFVTLLRGERAHVFPQLLPCLLDESRHWNASVNKMRGVVLGLCRDMDVILVTKLAHQIYQSLHTADTPAPATPADSLARLDALVRSLRPPESQAAASAESLLLATQIRVASSLPSQVKYSDFVFGHLLGEGSFASVRYAKWIQRGMLPSAWPEFAVKIVSKELVAQQDYARNLDREIRIMSCLSHENINRMVALCDNPQNTYLVLEYAHRGDLHTALSALGSLDVDSARFVAAEILRGLEEIHRNEIVYVDLKPENVLVHKSGHIKLSDFGSSRFFNEVGLGHSEGKLDRLEGTADYLAPELLRGGDEGGLVSPASDLWAFACVLYQLMAGRTPIWAGEMGEEAMAAEAAAKEGTSAAATSSASLDDPSLTPDERAALRAQAMDRHAALQKQHMLSKMVQFETALEDRFPPNFDPEARALIEAIMLPEPAQRIGVKRRNTGGMGGVQWELDYAALKAHPFFRGIDWALLPTLPAPKLEGGRVAPAPSDAAWARRKNSIMWAPMPKSYAFTEGGGVVMEPIVEDLLGETPAHVTQGGGMAAGARGGVGSLRAQMFLGRGGASAVPRFAGVPENAAGDSSMQLAEGDEEEEEEGSDDDDDDGDESMGSGRLHGSMLSAPLPSSSLPPRPPSKASSRASGPMAVVEAAKEDDSDDDQPRMGPGTGPASSRMQVGHSAAPLRPAIRGSLGLRGNLPPSGAGGASLPPSGAARPSASFVPLADATAGPTGLGMGMRRMGGNATASALLARVLNKPSSMPPTATLPDKPASQP